MKQLILGMAIGAVAGAMALKKMEKEKVPQKAIKMAKEKLEND